MGEIAEKLRVFSGLLTAYSEQEMRILSIADAVEELEKQKNNAFFKSASQGIYEHVCHRRDELQKCINTLAPFAKEMIDDIAADIQDGGRDTEGLKMWNEVISLSTLETPDDLP